MKAEAIAEAQAKEHEKNKKSNTYANKKQVTTLFPTEEENRKARVIKTTDIHGGSSTVLNIPGRTTDHKGRIIEISKPIVKNSYDLPEILQKKCPIDVTEITDGEIIKSA